MSRQLNLNRIPFDPARWPFFYGWFILVAGTLGILCSVPGQTIGVAAFTEPLIESLGIDRTALSLAYGIGTAASALLLTTAGRLYDRIGARWSMALATSAFGCVLATMSRLDRIAPALSRSTGLSPFQAVMVTAVAGFFCMRLLGPGMLTMLPRNMVMKWFSHRRGLANGIMGVFIGLGFSSAPVLFNSLIRAVSWQTAWLGLGISIGIGATLFVLVFYRDNPALCGLEPEGGRQPKPGAPAHEAEHHFTLGQALGTRAYWIYSLGLSMLALYATAFTFHIESILGAAGFDATMAYRIFMPTAVISVTLGLAGGWISDHVDLRVMLMTLLGGMMLSQLALLINTGWITFALAVAGNALAGAMFGVLLGVTWPRFYGFTHLGAISGFQMTMNVFFSAIGPAMFALSLRFTGSYHAATGACLAVVTLLLALAPRVGRRPIHPLA